MIQAKLVRAAPSDAAAVRHFVREAYAKWVPVFGREPMPMMADYALAVQNHEIDLAYLDGALVALIELIAKPDHLFIENIAVAPNHQGQGLGQFMMAHAEKRAQELGVPKLCLLTGQVMQSNVRFYQSLGFRIDRTEPFMGGFTVYMSKALAAV